MPVQDKAFAEHPLAIQKMLDAMPAQLWQMQDERTYGYVNAAHAAFLGKPASEIAGQDLYTLLSGPSATRCAAHYRAAISSGRAVTSDEWAHNAKGEARLLRIVLTPVFGQDGAFRFLGCMAEDITEQQRSAEQNLMKTRILSAIVRFSRELFSDEPDAIARGLSTLGEAARADRVYYWENRFDEAESRWLMSQKFEWCAEGIEPQIDNENLQDLPLEAFEDFVTPMRAHRPFLCHVKDIPGQATRETLLSQQIQSILALPVYRGDVFSGFVGFDSCVRERDWTESELTMLKTFVEVLEKSIQKDLLQREATQSRQNFESFFNTIDDLLFIMDQKGTILHVNQSAADKTGYSEQELVGNSILLLHPPEQHAQIKSHFAALAETSGTSCHEPILTKAGTQFPAETHAFSGEWDGKPAVFCVTQDTSLLEFSAEKFAKAFDQSSLLMAILNTETGKLLDVNDAFCRALHFSSAEVIGKRPGELQIMATPEDEAAMLRALHEKISLRGVEMTIQGKLGERHVVLVNANPITIGVLGCFVVSLNDITDRKRMEREIRQYNEQLEGMVQEKVQELSDAVWGTITALVRLTDSRDGSTGEHLRRIAEGCRIVCEKLAEDARYQDILTGAYIAHLEKASELHDIGKVGIRDSILLKEGKLTTEEFEIMKTHTTIGAETLEEAYRHYRGNDIIRMGIDVAASHHERWDGKGYPKGLRENDIPLPARIVAICDVYDALRSARSYKPAYSHQQSLEIIAEECGTHFCPDVCGAFLARADEIEAVYREYTLA